MLNKYIKIILGSIVLIALLMVAYYGAIWAIDYIDRKSKGVKEGVDLAGFNMSMYYRHEVEKIVKVLALEAERKPQDASLIRETGEVLPSKVGVKVHREETVDKIMESSGSTSFNLVTTNIEPEISTADLQAIEFPLGSYNTNIYGDYGRRENIRLATSSINNILVLPNQVFSFMETTGSITYERGYKDAPIIIDGRSARGIGGGICQVSSTLYNAVLNSGLEIVERHGHSKAVPYVPRGQDATVTDDGVDFKFKNTLDTPIIIRAVNENNQVKVTILGKDK